MSDEERIPRQSTLREKEERPSDRWVPASILPDPVPQDGWVFRWIRTGIKGESDNTHVSQMFREGWEPVRSAAHPELMIQSSWNDEFLGWVPFDATPERISLVTNPACKICWIQEIR